MYLGSVRVKSVSIWATLGPTRGIWGDKLALTGNVHGAVQHPDLDVSAKGLLLCVVKRLVVSEPLQALVHKLPILWMHVVVSIVRDLKATGK